MCNSIDLSDHLGLVLLWLSVFALCGCVPIMLLPRADGILTIRFVTMPSSFHSLFHLLFVTTLSIKQTFDWFFCQSHPDVAEFSSLKKWVNIHCNTSLKVSLNFQLGIEANRSQTLKLCTQDRVTWLHPFHISAVVHNFDRESQPSAFSPYCPVFKSSLQGNFCYSRLATIKTTEINLTWRKRTNIAYFPQLWNLTLKPSKLMLMMMTDTHRSQAGIQA